MVEGGKYRHSDSREMSQSTGAKHLVLSPSRGASDAAVVLRMFAKRKVGRFANKTRAGLQTQIRYLPGTLTICMVIRPWVSDGHEQRIYNSHKEPQNGNHASKLQQQTRNFNQKPLLISVKDSGFKRIPFAKLTLKLGPFTWNLPLLQTNFAQNKGHESHQASYLLKSPLY